MRPAPRFDRPQDGFTLIELMIVIVLVAVMASVAMPRLMPLLALSSHENEARKLAGFGRSAMSHAAFTHGFVTVKIDLDNQEYWAEAEPKRNYEPEEEILDDDEEEDEESYIPEDDAELFLTSKAITYGRLKDETRREIEDRLKEQGEPAPYEDVDFPMDDSKQDEILDRQVEVMMERFADSFRTSLSAQAKRVKHDEDYLLIMDEDDEDNPYNLDDDEILDEEGNELTAQEITEPLLRRTKLDKQFKLVSVLIGEEETLEGVVEIEISPLGLDTPVVFNLMNEDEDLITIHWDPVTGGAWYEHFWAGEDEAS